MIDTPEPRPQNAAAVSATHQECRSSTGNGRRRRPRLGLVAVVAGLSMLATACTGGPGDRDDFVEILVRDDGFNADEAGCIADAVFAQYGEDGDALGKISGAESYEFLTGPDGVEGFDGFFTSTVSDCTTVGPTE